MILLVFLLQLSDSLPPKPAPAPAAWRALIGAYADARDTLYVYEDRGALYAVVDSAAPVRLAPKSDSVFSSTARRPFDGSAVVFRRHEIQAGRGSWRRLQLGPAGGGQLRLEPVRPVAELLRADRALTPPAESGASAFLAPDLVEPAGLDSSIHLDIRYATTNNFLGSVFYSSPRAFLQRPAALALVQAARALRPLGYGLLIQDAYRPWYVTKVFWDATPAASRWLVADPARGSKHNRGAAVDVTLYDLATGLAVEMPSTYDEATPRAHADFPGGTSLQRWHRALLRRVLVARGFTVNPSEWWHFDFWDWERYPILNTPFEDLLRRSAPQDTIRFTHADTLRGSNGSARAWWDVQFYDLHTRVNPRDSSITGWNGITYRVLQPAQQMQIDLQMPLEIDSMVQDRRKLAYRRDGNAFFVTLVARQRAGETRTITVWYHGKPRVGRRLPWDGGFTFPTDSLGHLWIATANEGLGASVWWPNKDYLADEPDSQRIAITVPDSIIDVSNGRLRSTTKNPDRTATYEWFVTSPINNYDVAINAGQYTHFSDTLDGEAGRLTLDFWPLVYHADTARRQFQQVIPMLRCFEHWFGPYPWYADGYKLVETPHLGMEHQSAVAYGNHFLNGYLGHDLSRTGLGLQWDFIIVHESAHEWWGNNISAQDHADMWLHESFANYAEGIYTECRMGKMAGAAYMIGARAGVRNDRPIVPAFGVNAQGSGDMYPKGGNMLHTIRAIIDDDAKWRDILRGLNKTFWHQTVTGRQVEDYISREAGIDLSKVFAQYLTTTQIPAFEYRVESGRISYHWANVVPGFDMPVRVNVPGLGTRVLHPTEAWQTLDVASAQAAELSVDENFYVTARVIGATSGQ